MQDVNWIARAMFLLLFGLITWSGFAAAKWRKGDLDLLDEWWLGGRRFGTVITWFLIGGDLYTAYTFIAVPALPDKAEWDAFDAADRAMSRRLSRAAPALRYIRHLQSAGA